MKRRGAGIAVSILCWFVVSLAPLRAQAFDSMQNNPLQLADKEYEAALANWGDGKSADNEALLKSALTIRTQMLGPDHASVADVLERLGAIDYNRGHYAFAEIKFRQALAIYTKSLGEEDQFTLRTMGDLGAALREEGRYDEARKIVERSVSLRRQTLPPNSPMIAGGLNNLGRIYLAQGRFSKAQDALTESARIFRASGYEARARDDDALVQRAISAAAGVDRLLLVALAGIAATVLFGGSIIGCTLAAENAFAADPPRLPARSVTALMPILQVGLLLGSVGLGVGGMDTILALSGANLDTSRGLSKAGAVLGIVLIQPILQILTNLARQAAGLPQMPVMLFGRQIGQTSQLDQMQRLPTVRWWFPAFEYHTFAANHVIKMFVTRHALCGARFSRLTSGTWTLPMQLTDATFWTLSAQARAYDRLDPESSAFLLMDDANFQINWKEVSSLEYITGRKWAAGSIPHTGRLIVRLRSGEPREFLLLGNQDGEDLKSKLERFRTEDAVRNTVGSPAVTTESSVEA